MDQIMTAFIQQAIPHEAGHILVGRNVGVPVYGLDIFVGRGASNEVLVGNFATRAVEPPPVDLAFIPRSQLEGYISMIGGGLAGNIVSGIAPAESGTEKDRADLERVSSLSLEEAAKRVMSVIERRMDIFNNLRMLIEDRYAKLMKSADLSPGRYNLLTSKDLEPVCPQDKNLFPPELYR